MSNPPQPNQSIINSYLSKWKTLENYTLQEKSLNLLFHSYCPDNNQIEQVLLKVSALNDFYSTNIFDTYTVAKHILKCNIDNDLGAGNEALVNKIAPVTINGKTRNFYSFASKYCSHHKPESYPIYDSYVDKMLMHFKKKDKYAFLLYLLLTASRSGEAGQLKIEDVELFSDEYNIYKIRMQYGINSPPIQGHATHRKKDGNSHFSATLWTAPQKLPKLTDSGDDTFTSTRVNSWT